MRPQQHKMKARKAHYQQNLDRFQTELRQLAWRYNLLAYSRMAAFLLGAAGTYLAFRYSPEAGLLAGAVAMAIFLALVARHSRVADQRDYLRNLIGINEKEIAILNRQWDGLEEGAAYVNPEHAYSYDMDLFGRASVFQYLNRSCTIVGRDCLADWLQHPLQNAAAIRARQEGVKELGEKNQWTQHFQATGRGKFETTEETEALLSWLETGEQLHRYPVYRLLLILLPLLFVASLVLFVLGALPAFSGSVMQQFSFHIPVALFVLNLMVVGLRLKDTNHQQVQVGKKARLLRKYAALIKAVEAEDFSAGYLLALQEKLQHAQTPASDAIHQLAGISYYLDQRLNPFAGVLLNGMLLWDLQCIWRLERWKRRYRADLPRWFASISEMDALQSLGCFAFNHPGYTWPEVDASSFHLKAVRLGHPLIPEEVRVDNDLHIEAGQFLIITGANMAGKSTFLRTVGVNLVLAMNGAPVCAQHFSFSPVSLITSVRATDSLEANESYFFAELKRLKRIIDRLKQGPVFIIVDEMLRGTNSRDKQIGSRRFIEQLLALGGMGLVATHDLSLGELAEAYPGQVRNKRFEVDIREDKLYFDYRLRDGISQNLNATFLMQQMGIMPAESAS